MSFYLLEYLIAVLVIHPSQWADAVLFELSHSKGIQHIFNARAYTELTYRAAIGMRNAAFEIPATLEKADIEHGPYIPYIRREYTGTKVCSAVIGHISLSRLRIFSVLAFRFPLNCLYLQYDHDVNLR